MGQRGDTFPFVYKPAQMIVHIVLVVENGIGTDIDRNQKEQAAFSSMGMLPHIGKEICQEKQC